MKNKYIKKLKAEKNLENQIFSGICPQDSASGLVWESTSSLPGPIQRLIFFTKMFFFSLTIFIN